MMKVKDKEVVNAMFRALRKAGFEAKQRLDWNNATEEQQESKNILWIDTDSICRQKGFENYMSDGTLNRDLHISYSLTEDGVDRAYEVMSQFGLEVVKPENNWKPFIIKPKKRLIKEEDYYRYIYLSVKGTKAESEYFNDIGEEQVCNRSWDSFLRTVRSVRIDYRCEYGVELYEKWQNYEWEKELEKLEEVC